MATQAQPQLTWEGIRAGLNRWAADQGWPYGMPFPSLSESVQNRLVVARHAPHSDKAHWPTYAEMVGKAEPCTHACTSDDMFHIVNQWIDRDGCLVVIIIDEEGKRRFHKETPAMRVVDRYRAIKETASARLGSVSAKAEMTAQFNLLTRLNETQGQSYLINGMFAETSKRSHVTYVLRKGFPTLAIKKNEAEGTTKFLCALCLHPLAYYEDTFAGAMVPSDDVLAHLLMMRSDEHRFWRESGQHPMWDWRSGI